MSGATDLRPPRAGDTSLSTLMPPGGDEALALHDWPLPADTPARGTVLLVHGLGEHAGRYVQVAARLNEWGFSVRGYDQYGHGESSGVRGSLSSEGRLLEDLATVIDDTRSRLDDRQPLILLGHSMGGLVAARLVSLRLRRVEGLVLSSPALDAGLSLGQKALLATLYRLAPDARVGNGLDTRYLSHDSAVIAPTKPTRWCTTALVRGWRTSSPPPARRCWRARRAGRCRRCCSMPVRTASSARRAAWISRARRRRSS